MRTRFTTAILLAVFAVPCAEAAPQPLLNKTVTFSFTNDQVLREASGRTFNSQASFTYIDYISSAGHIFQRSSRSTGNQTKSSDKDPDKARVGRGEVHTNRFEGNNLVIMNSYPEGAVRMVVSFDASFSTCSVDVLLARQGGGKIMRRGLDGVLREIVSYNIGNKSCSIRDGNPFGN